MRKKKKGTPGVKRQRTTASPSAPEKALDQSPLFAMSKASMENFHSNFWAWLVNHDPKRFAGVFFEELDGEVCEARREENKRDLTICVKDAPNELYVVENKLKALPDRKQLERYRTESRLKGFFFVRGIYTGFYKLPGKTEDWTHVPFQEIIERIAERAKNTKGTLRSFLRDYVTMARNVVSVIESESKRLRDSLPLLCKEKTNLEELGLQDAVHKWLASRFCTERLGAWTGGGKKKRIGDRLFRIIASSGFNNKKWNITVKFIEDVPESGNQPKSKKKDEPSRIELGIQIENRQFRRFAEVTNAVGKKIDPKAIWKRYSALGWLDDKDHVNAGWSLFNSALDSGSSQKGCFGKYSPGFAYQYRKLSGDTISCQALAREIRNQLELLVGLVRNNPGDFFDIPVKQQ